MAKRSFLPFAIPSTFKLTDGEGRKKKISLGKNKEMVLRFVNNKVLKNGSLCKNERCESCFYCTDRLNNPACEYFLMTGERRNSGIGDECDKWRGLKDR